METTKAALAVLGAHLRSWALWATGFQAKVVGFSDHLVWKATEKANSLNDLMSYRVTTADAVVALAKVYQFVSQTYQDGYWTGWWYSHEIAKDEANGYDVVIYPCPISLGGPSFGCPYSEIGDMASLYITRGISLPIGIEDIVHVLNHKVNTDDDKLSWGQAIHLDNVWLALEKLTIDRSYKVEAAQNVSHMIRAMMETTKKAILDLGAINQRIQKAYQMENTMSILGDTFYQCGCSYCRTEDDETRIFLLCKDDQTISESHLYDTHCIGCLALALISRRPEVRQPSNGLDTDATLNDLYYHPLGRHPSTPPAAMLLSNEDVPCFVASDHYLSTSREMTTKV